MLHGLVTTAFPGRIGCIAHVAQILDAHLAGPESGGTWAATWGDDEDNPDYLTIARISTYDPPALLELSDYRYASKEGDLPFEAVFTTRFLCRAHGNGTVLRVEQTGFPMDQEAFCQACVQGWADTFVGIRRFLSDRD